MFRKRRQDSLPTSSNAAPSAFHLPQFPTQNSSNGSYQVADGSGKAIHMEAPLARAWKKASTYTRGTYYCLAAFLFMAYFGYRWLRWNHASVHLVCHTEECTFQLTPKGWNGKYKVIMPRRQLISAEAMKTDKLGNFVAVSPRLDDFNDRQVQHSGHGKAKKYKRTSTSYKGPDLNGHYPSYRITIRESTRDPTTSEQTGDSVDGGSSEEIPDADLTSLKPFLEQNEFGDWSINLRKFNIFQSRRRVKTTVQKIESYSKRRRHQLTVKENTPPAWQGILLLVLGIFGFLLTVLIGQFWDEPVVKHSGPGARVRNAHLRQSHQPQQQKQQRMGYSSSRGGLGPSRGMRH